MSIPNPNGANGYTSDPREQICWDNYVKSITKGGKGNAYKAAKDAGYEKSSAITITTREWFIERLKKLKRKEMLSDAEKVLQKTLKYKTEKNDGEVKTDLLRVQTDVAKHITKTLGKDEGYSEKQEIDHTSKGEKIEGVKLEIDLSKLSYEELRRLAAEKNTVERGMQNKS